MMAVEHEIQRLIVRLMGDGSSYKGMLDEASAVTDKLTVEMKRLGGTEADYAKITSQSASITKQATMAIGAFNFEQRRLQGLLDAGRISQDSYNKQLDKMKPTVAAANAELEKHLQIITRGIAITLGTETATEAYRRKVAELKGALDAGSISQVTFNRAMATA